MQVRIAVGALAGLHVVAAMCALVLLAAGTDSRINKITQAATGHIELEVRTSADAHPACFRALRNYIVDLHR